MEKKRDMGYNVGRHYTRRSAHVPSAANERAEGSRMVHCGGYSIFEKRKNRLRDERDTEQISGKKKEKHWDLKQYMAIALLTFVTFCCCILFFFMIYRYNGFTDFWRHLVWILQPITIGVVLAYLLNPVMKFIEKYLLKLLVPHMKRESRARKTARGIAIAGALLFLTGIIVLLVLVIVPSVARSIQNIAQGFPNEINMLIDWVEDFTQGDSEVAEMVSDGIETVSTMFQNFVETEILPQVQVYLMSITSGVIYGVKLLTNVLVGVIVSVYVLSSKETFAGQAKKIIYAVFKPTRANIIVDTVRKSNQIFGGFISGKLLDSAIIGVLAYIVLVIMKMPDTMLLAVIIGVTNVIPFFGPFIGAIPAFIIVVLQNPIQGLYLLIFIFILQQIDGNIIGPKILGESTGITPFWVVTSILVFGGLWGFPGMLLGVPVTAVLQYIARNLLAYALGKRGLVSDTASYVELVRVDKVTNELIYSDDSEESKADDKPEEA